MKIRHSCFLFIVLLVSLLGATAMACSDPECPPCLAWNGSHCVWDCGPTDSCCDDECWGKPCCNGDTEQCQTSAAVCCGFPTTTCCDNVCCYSECCDPGEACCGTQCWGGLCCNDEKCDPGDICCGTVGCCPGECCSGAGTFCCGNIPGRKCCDNLACYNSGSEKCCGYGNGTYCPNEKICCGFSCCDPTGGYPFCDEIVTGTCVSECPTGTCASDGRCVTTCPEGECCDDGKCESLCSGDTCCDDGTCRALVGCEKCANGIVEDDPSKCPGECNNCTDAQCHYDDALCDTGEVCVEATGACCDTASAGDCVATAADLDYDPTDCVRNLAGCGGCTGGVGCHVASGWTQTPTHQDQTGPGTVGIYGCADVTFIQCMTIPIGLDNNGYLFDCVLDTGTGFITSNYGWHDHCPGSPPLD